MTRSLLIEAADELEMASAATSDSDARARLDDLADQLRRQATREATPALGALDRVQLKLQEINRQSEASSVEEAIDRARNDILSFLETLNDRGMTQH